MESPIQSTYPNPEKFLIDVVYALKHQAELHNDIISYICSFIVLDLYLLNITEDCPMRLLPSIESDQDLIVDVPDDIRKFLLQSTVVSSPKSFFAFPLILSVLCEAIEESSQEYASRVELENSILLCYRQFLSNGFELLEFFKLKLKSLSSSLSLSSSSLASSSSYSVIKKRIFNILSNWINNFWENLIAEGEVLLNYFLVYLSSSAFSLFNTRPLRDKIILYLNERFKEKQTKRIIPNNDSNNNSNSSMNTNNTNNKKKNRESEEYDRYTENLTPLLEFEWDSLIPIKQFLNLDSRVIANQLSFITWKLFSKLKIISPELIDLTWKKAKANEAFFPSQSLITWPNYLYIWVQNVVLLCNETKRDKVILKIMEITSVLFEIGDFHTLVALAGALQHQNIRRLTKSIKYVTKKTNNKETIMSFDQIQDLTSSIENYKNLRSAITERFASGKPCIPFLGIDFTDLIFIREGMQVKLDATNEINIFKFKIQWQLLSLMLKFQERNYMETLGSEDIEIQKLFLKCYCRVEEVLYSISIYIQPKQGSTTKAEKPQILINYELYCKLEKKVKK